MKQRERRSYDNRKHKYGHNLWSAFTYINKHILVVVLFKKLSHIRKSQKVLNELFRVNQSRSFVYGPEHKKLYQMKHWI